MLAIFTDKHIHSDQTKRSSSIITCMHPQWQRCSTIKVRCCFTTSTLLVSHQERRMACEDITCTISRFQCQEIEKSFVNASYTFLPTHCKVCHDLHANWSSDHPCLSADQLITYTKINKISANHFVINLVPMQLLMMRIISSRFVISTAMLTSSFRIVSRSSNACRNAPIITVGCICCSRNGPATESISPAAPVTITLWPLNGHSHTTCVMS